jgi:hypothetical protein
MHPNPLTVHGLQFGLDRKDEHLDIGQDVPAVMGGERVGRKGAARQRGSGEGHKTSAQYGAAGPTHCPMCRTDIKS